MARPLDLEIANFVCRFGDRLVLNDLLEEVVLPAFFREDARQYGETQYFFTDQKFGYLKKDNIDSLALRCRFIKNTVLRRHQIYSPTDGLVSDEQALESAPSAIAILLLKSHRLIFLREVPFAPTPAQFGTTFQHFLRQSMESYHLAAYQEGNRSGRRITKKSLRDQFPFPSVDVVPVVSSESLKHFVKRFDVLNTLKIEVAPTNSELDNSELFRMLRASKEDVASQKTVVQHQNPKGLDKDGCIAHVEAAKQGNARIQMKGVDENGDALIGNNENFSVHASLGEPADGVDERATDAFEKYEELVDNKVIDIGKPTRDDTDKLKDVYHRFEQGQ
jgi:hypothetical protein